MKIGLSQKNLGIAAGIDEFSSSARMNQYETGKHVPDFATAKHLARILDVPTSYLYEEDDDIAELLRMLYKLDGSKKKQVKDKITDLLQIGT